MSHIQKKDNVLWYPKKDPILVGFGFSEKPVFLGAMLGRL